MVSVIAVELWYKREENNWMIKIDRLLDKQCLGKQICEEFKREEVVGLNKNEVNAGAIEKINDVQHEMESQVPLEEENSTIPIMPVKIFCSAGSHVCFLEEVRRRYNRYTLKGKHTFKNALDEYRTLPVKLVRYGRKPWKPVPIIHTSELDGLNWTVLTESRLKYTASIKETGKDDAIPAKVPHKECSPPIKYPRPPPSLIPKPSPRYKKNNDAVMNKENTTSPVLFSQRIDIDITDEVSPRKTPLPSPMTPPLDDRHVHGHAKSEFSYTTFTTQVKNIRNEIESNHAPPNTEDDCKIGKDNIVLHFDSPVLANKRKGPDREDSFVRLNSPLTRRENSSVLSEPIIETDDAEVDFGCSPPLSRRRKSSEKREQRKSKGERNEQKDVKEHKKNTWFTKSESKTKTIDNAMSSPKNTTTDIKSKFKKQHRKSKSVLVPPTYYTANTQEKSPPREKSSLTRKCSLGSSPRDVNKSEKPSLFRRFYGSPHVDKKFDTRADELIITPTMKRTRRYTQPVGDLQKEFIKELKGKLDKYSTDNTIRLPPEPKEKVLWNMNI